MSTKNTQNSLKYHNPTNTEKSDSNSSGLVKNFVLGVGLTNETEENILEYVVKNLPKQHKSYYIVTPNPEMIVLANNDSGFKTTLNGAHIALCDGMQLYRAAMFLGVPLKERIIGTNFVEKLCEKVANRPITVGFLGGGKKIAEKVSECLRQKYPGLKVVFAESEWEEFLPTSEQPAIDILFVALGFPKQEEWMAKHVEKIPVKVMMGVGGALDQIVDPSLRPPEWIHSVGLGWLYRLIREPWRIKRQIRLVSFANLVLQNKFTQN